MEDSERNTTKEEGEPTNPDSAQDDSESKTKSKWSKEQILTVVFLATMTFTTFLSFGVIAPFFPVEAKKKGVSAAEIGLIFGAFQLVIFLTSPLYGMFINKFDIRLMVTSGAMLCGLSNIGFGFLDEISNPKVFLALCFICRILEANGSAMLVTGNYVIMTKRFPENVAFSVGVLNTSCAIGIAIGPAIGGGLYELGGYKTPFMVIGGIAVVTAIITRLVLPKVDHADSHSGTFLPLFKSPGGLVMFLVVVTFGISICSLDPILGPFLVKQFNTPVGLIGLFFVYSAAFGIFAPIMGHIADKGWHGSLIVTGSVVSGLSFMFLGPCPLFRPAVPVTLFGVVLSLVSVGISLAALAIPIFPLMLTLARTRGYDESLQTYGIVSGFYTSGISLGSFVGPTMSAYISGVYGFGWSTSVNGLIILAVSLVFVAYLTTMVCKKSWPLQALSSYKHPEANEELKPIIAMENK